MSDKIDMSLEDIIKKSRGPRQAVGRGSRSRGKAYLSEGGKLHQGKRKGVGRGRRPMTMSHGKTPSSTRGGFRNEYNRHSSTTKLIVENLDFGVSDTDIQELFSDLGRLKTAAVHYDRSGRSLGTADVIFERKGDAIKAMKQYNGVPLDGRAMVIKMATNSGFLSRQSQSEGSKKRVNKGNPQKRSKGEHVTKTGGKREKRNGKPSLTTEELDKQLDTYNSARS